MTDKDHVPFGIPPHRTRQALPMKLLRRMTYGMILMFCLFPAGCSDTSVAVRDPDPTGCTDTTGIHTGEATFYTFASGAGACMFDSTPGDLMIGAMNSTDYAGSAICGSCAEVTGPRGTIRIRLVDLCPGCPAGNIDLSPLAFSYLADTALGRIPIHWSIVPCSVTGPIIYHFKDGSNRWWTAVQIRNHRHPIRSLEYRSAGGAFVSVPRTSYNYFVEQSGMGPGPYTFRVTDIYGHVLVDSGVVHVENGDVAGSGQFLPCAQ
jgi:expansin (peptidoglycan-binding protein)